MKAMPLTSTTRPTWVNSNMPSGSRPSLVIAPLTATFVEVPIRVQVPPRIAAKASGMSKREGGTPIRRARPITGPRNTAVTVVLFIKAEMSPTTAMSTVCSSAGRLPSPRASSPPIASKMPVSRSAAPMMKMEASSTMTRSPKPAKAWSTRKMPHRTSTHSIPTVTKSTEIFSVAKAMSAMMSSEMTIQASMNSAHLAQGAGLLKAQALQQPCRNVLEAT